MRLVFQREGRELWTSAALLKSKSPYFKDLLSTGFKEGEKVTVKSPLKSDKPIEATFDDSDEEMDEAEPAPKSSGATFHCPTPFHEILVEGTSYCTYRAVLLWLATDHISLAPLTSTLLGPDSSREAVRKARALSASFDFGLPPPVSCKSVYRLARFLSLPSLTELALVDYKSKLSASTIGYELVSDDIGIFDELSGAVVDYAARNWNRAKAEGAIQVLEGKAKEGGSVELALRLLGKLQGSDVVAAAKPLESKGRKLFIAGMTRAIYDDFDTA